MDREQAHRIGALLLCDGLELARADGLLLRNEADEAFDVGPAELLVRAGEPRKLAHVRVTPAAVPLREHGEVVVVRGDDLLAEPLEGEPRHRLDEPVVALPERAHETLVALGEPGRQRVLERRRRAAAATRPAAGGRARRSRRRRTATRAPTGAPCRRNGSAAAGGT